MFPVLFTTMKTQEAPSPNGKKDCHWRVANTYGLLKATIMLIPRFYLK